MDGKKESVPAFDRFLFIVFGALIAYLLFAAAGVYGQEPPQPITYETVESPICDIKHSKPEPGIMPALEVRVGITFKDGTTWWKKPAEAIIPIKYHLERKTVRDQWRVRFSAMVKATEVCGIWDLELHEKMEEEQQKQLASKGKK